MRKQTDLAKVKQTALALLSTEINETSYSPMIVKHPFTDTGVSAIPDGKGGVEMIDLTEDDAQLKWRQSMARQIDKADNAYAIYMMVTNLVTVANEFAYNYVWHGEKSGKFLKLCGEQYGAVFDETDFIEYLNTVLYPDKPSKKIKTFQAADDEDVPEEYRKYPYYNF